MEFLKYMVVEIALFNFGFSQFLLNSHKRSQAAFYIISRHPSNSKHIYVMCNKTLNVLLLCRAESLDTSLCKKKFFNPLLTAVSKTGDLKNICTCREPTESMTTLGLPVMFLHWFRAKFGRWSFCKLFEQVLYWETLLLLLVFKIIIMYYLLSTLREVGSLQAYRYIRSQGAYILNWNDNAVLLVQLN